MSVEAIRRAVLRARVAPVPTVLLQIGGLDLNGLRNIARPFEADVEALAGDYGLDPATVVLRRLLLTATQVEQHAVRAGAPTERPGDSGRMALPLHHPG